MGVSRGRGWAITILVSLVVAGLVTARFVDVASYLGPARQWVGSLGASGPVVFVLLYMLSTSLGFPGTPLTVLAALLFGTFEAFITMVAATTLTSVLGFFLARTIMQDPLRRRLENNATFQKLDRMVRDDHFIVVPFVRLMPVFPYTLVNYGLGLTTISFWKYLLASELVMIPMNAILILGSHALYRIIVRGEASWVLIGSSTAAALLVLGLGYFGKRVLGSGAPSHQPRHTG